MAGRGRSSCPIKAFYGSGAEQQAPCALKGTPRPLPSGPRVPHVTSFFARAPSSLLFCRVCKTHKHLTFCKYSEEFGQCPLSLRIHSALALFAQRQLVVFCAKAPLMAVSRLFLYRNAVVIALRTQSRERRHPPPRAMGGRSRIPFSEERVRRTVTNTAILTNYLFV